jgi:hypothetical protein
MVSLTTILKHWYLKSVKYTQRWKSDSKDTLPNKTSTNNITQSTRQASKVAIMNEIQHGKGEKQRLMSNIHTHGSMR